MAKRKRDTNSFIWCSVIIVSTAKSGTLARFMFSFALSVCVCIWMREREDRDQRAQGYQVRWGRGGKPRKNKKFKECCKTVSHVLNHRLCPSGGRLWLLWYKVLAEYMYVSSKTNSPYCWCSRHWDLRAKRHCTCSENVFLAFCCIFSCSSDDVFACGPPQTDWHAYIQWLTNLNKVY